MHERYLFPAALPLLVAAILLGQAALTDRVKGLGSLGPVVAWAGAASVLLLAISFSTGELSPVWAAVPPLIAVSFFFAGPMLWATFLLVTTIHFVNLYHVFIYPLYNEEGTLRVGFVLDGLESGNFLGTGYETVQVFSGMMVVSFFIGLAVAYSLSSRTDTQTQPR